MIREIKKVKALEGFLLECTMDNGDIIEYNMKFILEAPGSMRIPLRDPEFFKQVFLELGQLTWPNGYDIHANTVATDGKLIKAAA